MKFVRVLNYLTAVLSAATETRQHPLGLQELFPSNVHRPFSRPFRVILKQGVLH